MAARDTSTTPVNPDYAVLEWAVLHALCEWIDEWRVPSSEIASATNIPPNVVKAVLRELIDAGLVTLGTAWTDEGMACGSGYSATPQARRIISQKGPST